MPIQTNLSVSIESLSVATATPVPYAKGGGPNLIPVTPNQIPVTPNVIPVTVPPPFRTRCMHPFLKFHRISQSQHSTQSFVPCLAFFRGLSHLEHCLPFPHVTIGLLRRPPHISPCHLGFTPLHCFSCPLSSGQPICRSSSGFLPLAHHLA